MKQIKKKQKTYRSTKVMFFVLSFMTMLLFLVGATYAWTTYNDQRINAVRGEDLSLQINITGNLTPEVLSPNLTVEKKVQVRNNSSARVLIRVKLEEALLSFDIDTVDQTGNANIKDYGSSISPTNIIFDDPATWIVGDYFKTAKNFTYKGNSLVTNSYEKLETSRPAILKDNLHLQFSDRVLDSNPSDADAIQDQYWLYYDGYFYYSDRVYTGNSTSVLLDKVSLDENAPNTIKGSFYNISAKAEAILSNQVVLEAWSIPEGTDVYDMYSRLW